MVPIQHLLSLPPGLVSDFEQLEGLTRPEWFATSDPADRKLGSGGGTAHLLVEAWKATGADTSFEEWLQSSKKLMVHAGGQSRRLPAYAPVGKLFMPIPVFRWALGQRLDQTLLEVQLPDYQRVIRHAGENYATMVASGDVLLRFGRELPAFPEVDVLGLGMWVTPEIARNFGVYFCHRRDPSQLAFFLQKPTPARIRELSPDYFYLIDTGMWLLSPRAVSVLLKKCGWDSEEDQFAAGVPSFFELYSDFGLALGSHPFKGDTEISTLTSAVVPLPQAEFYHLGASRQMIEAVSALQHLELDETKLGLMGAKRHPDQYLQNSNFGYPLRLEENHTLWVENSSVNPSWKLEHDHVLTGIPDNEWDLKLEAGVCLDFIPVDNDRWCIRAYGIDDTFSGQIGETNTKWFGRPAPNWFFGRSISREDAGIQPGQDIQAAKIFPVLKLEEINPRFIEWLFQARPENTPTFAQLWMRTDRLSAQEIQAHANLKRLYTQRAANRQLCLTPMLKNFRWSVFFKLDLEHTASLFAGTTMDVPSLQNADEYSDGMVLVRDAMFRAAVKRHRKQEGVDELEKLAFARLREMIVGEARALRVEPHRNLLEDQIVWGRSPVRLDLAGGWTDTPPYCIEHGGRVLNLAVDLNGQPPIQVFAKLSAKPQLVLRSIDLGVEERVTTYEELDSYAEPGSEFALAKAACALAGFLPRFQTQQTFGNLKEQLSAFGGGLEISMLSAVPKGSGLGTSSILAATLLATLSDACGLGWDKNILFSRTLALEQLLTTGGGWQDQAGGLYRGIKLLETTKGLEQKLTLRWCPEHLFSAEHANKTIFLYYTGITRLAKNILHEIVRGIFLNSPSHLHVVEEIGANANVAFNAIQRSDRDGLLQSIRTSWELNQRLDSGTNPPEIQKILESAKDYISACKLLGAGGGGYLLLFAKDEEAGVRLKKRLLEKRPNERARFVDFQVSETGLQLTRS